MIVEQAGNGAGGAETQVQPVERNLAGVSSVELPVLGGDMVLDGFIQLGTGSKIYLEIQGANSSHHCTVMAGATEYVAGGRSAFELTGRNIYAVAFSVRVSLRDRAAVTVVGGGEASSAFSGGGLADVAADAVRGLRLYCSYPISKGFVRVSAR